MSIPDSYYASIWRPNLWLPKQIAMRESSENPYEVSDAGDAIGLFQQHWDFIETWAPMPLLDPARSLTEVASLHWSPGVWALALRNFLSRHYTQQITVAAALRIFHYGHDDAADPDGYVARVASTRPSVALGWTVPAAGA